MTGTLLLENQSAVSNVPIQLSYSINDGQSWNDITSAYTSTEGSYSALWAPSATGAFLVKASYVGLYPYQSSQTRVQLSVLPYNNQYVFAVSSNSTVTSLAFNSQSNTLSFTVSGPSGTTGYVDIQIAKSLVPNIANLAVSFDGNNLVYTATSTSDSYLLHFTYNHSTHTVTVNLGNAPTSSPTNNPTSTPKPTTSPTATPTPAIPESSIVILVVLVLALPFVLLFRKKQLKR